MADQKRKSKGKKPVAKRPSGKQTASAKRNAVSPSRRETEIRRTQQSRRRKYKRNYTLYYMMFGVLLVVLGTVLSLTVFFKITEIRVEGSSVYSQSDVVSLLSVKEGNNLIRVPVKKIEEALFTQLTAADSVTVKRDLPSTLLIQIEDGEAAFQLYDEEKYYQISGKGRIIGITASPADAVGVITGISVTGGKEGDFLQDVIEEEKNTDILILQQAFSEVGIEDISLVDLSDSLSITFFYQDRLRIDIGSFTNLNDKLLLLKETLDKGNIGVEEKGTIDLTRSDMLIFNNIKDPEFPEEFTGIFDWSDGNGEETSPEQEESSEKS